MFPVLSERHNIVVIADEAHRTQYGFEAKLKTRRKSYKPNEALATVNQAQAAINTVATGDGMSAQHRVEFAPPAYAVNTNGWGFRANGWRRLANTIEGEIKSRFASNVVQNRKFSELLGSVITRYQNRSIETAQVMEELVEMAKKFRDAAVELVLRQAQVMGENWEAPAH